MDIYQKINRIRAKSEQVMGVTNHPKHQKIERYITTNEKFFGLMKPAELDTRIGRCRRIRAQHHNFSHLQLPNGFLILHLTTSASA